MIFKSNGIQIQRMHVTNSEKMTMSSIIWSCNGFSSHKETFEQRFDRTSAFLGAYFGLGRQLAHVPRKQGPFFTCWLILRVQDHFCECRRRKWNGEPTVSATADINSSFERPRHNLSTTPSMGWSSNPTGFNGHTPLPGCAERRNGGSALHANGTETTLGAGTKDVQVFMHQRMAQQALA
jgi:hypothetical protein